MDESSTPPTCPRCGTVLPPYSGRGRHRVWCSDECRRRARDERAVAQGTAVPVRVDVRTDRVRIETLERELARTRQMLKAADRDRSNATRRALTAEHRLTKSAEERNRLVAQNHQYRQYLRELPLAYRVMV